MFECLAFLLYKLQLTMPISMVWKFFTITADKTSGVCRLCGIAMVFSQGSTTGFTRHLRAKHRSEYNAALLKKVQNPFEYNEELFMRSQHKYDTDFSQSDLPSTSLLQSERETEKSKQSERDVNDIELNFPVHEIYAGKGFFSKSDDVKVKDTTSNDFKENPTLDEEEHFKFHTERNKGSSFVWDHVRLAFDGKSVQCLICDKILNYSQIHQSTSAINRHLKLKHGLNNNKNAKKHSTKKLHGTKQKERSFVWKHVLFPADGKSVQCSHCGEILKYSKKHQSTSSIRYHLMKVHDLNDLGAREQKRNKEKDINVCLNDGNSSGTEADSDRTIDFSQSNLPSNSVIKSDQQIEESKQAVDKSNVKSPFLTKPKRGFSYIWDHVLLAADGHSVQCLICHKKITYYGTSLIRRHLIIKHGLNGRTSKKHKRKKTNNMDARLNFDYSPGTESDRYIDLSHLNLPSNSVIKSEQFEDTEQAVRKVTSSDFSFSGLDKPRFDKQMSSKFPFITERKRGKSYVWDHVLLAADGNSVKCSFCSKKLNYSQKHQSTTAIRRHLINIHGLNDLGAREQKRNKKKDINVCLNDGNSSGTESDRTIDLSQSYLPSNSVIKSEQFEDTEQAVRKVNSSDFNVPDLDKPRFDEPMSSKFPFIKERKNMSYVWDHVHLAADGHSVKCSFCRKKLKYSQIHHSTSAIRRHLTKIHGLKDLGAREQKRSKKKDINVCLNDGNSSGTESDRTIDLSQSHLPSNSEIKSEQIEETKQAVNKVNSTDFNFPDLDNPRFDEPMYQSIKYRFNMKRKQGKSYVWDHVHLAADGHSVKCSICRKRFSYSQKHQSTSTIRRHLIKSHGLHEDMREHERKKKIDMNASDNDNSSGGESNKTIDSTQSNYPSTFETKLEHQIEESEQDGRKLNNTLVNNPYHEIDTVEPESCNPELNKPVKETENSSSNKDFQNNPKFDKEKSPFLTKPKKCFSFVWDHVLLAGDGQSVQCSICHKKIKYAQSTTMIRGHLKIKHGLVEMVHNRKYEKQINGLLNIDDYSSDESLLWKFFIPQGDQAECQVCGDVMKQGGRSYSGLKHHLLLNHNTEILVELDKDKKGKLNKKQTSMAWIFFTRMSDQESETVRCLLCGQVYGYHSSTSQMLRHVELKHKTYYEAQLMDEVQRSEFACETKHLTNQPLDVTQTEMPCSSYSSESEADGFDSSCHATSVHVEDSIEGGLNKCSVNKPTTSLNLQCEQADEVKNLAQLTGEFILSVLQPFSLVENKYFQKILKSFNCGYQLPSEDNVSRKFLSETYDAVLLYQFHDKGY